MMKMRCLNFCLTVLCGVMVHTAAMAQLTYDEQVEQYIAQYKSIAMEEMQRTHIPASITLAQGIIESSAGQSPLATQANNHFGIKCHEDWKGETYYYDDDKKQECFRKYPSAADSYKDHSDFLTGRQRYAVLFTYKPGDYVAWAKGLKRCGYATNPRYAEVLIKCIEDNDLHQWDLQDAQRPGWFARINKKKTDDAVKEDAVTPDSASGSLNASATNAGRIIIFNNIKTVTLNEGESLNDLATRYQIGLRRLMRYNDITDVTQEQPGDRIYLQPKRKNGDSDVHEVLPGESMFSISRDHGIQLRELYAKNKMVLGTQPAAGETLFLRADREAAPQTADALPPGTITGDITAPVAPYHVVTKGDTLYSIAKQYNMTVEELKRKNKLYTDHLMVGQRLQVQQ